MITSGYSPQAEKSLVLITGMFGSGHNMAVSVLEEVGRYVADNLPPELIIHMVELSFEADSPVERFAIVTDVCSCAFVGSSEEVLDGLRSEGHQPHAIFFDANDDTLTARYDPVRRTHPLQENGTLSQGIVAKRRMLLPVKGMLDLVMDTSDMSAHDLRRGLEHQLSDTASKIQQITIESSGFKHDAPHDVDTLFGVRFFPNPYWIPELCAGRGTNRAVVGYILSQPESQGLLDNVTSLIELILPEYRCEGKDFVTIAVGCTGGHHRNVTISEASAKKLEGVSGINANAARRDIDRN